MALFPAFPISFSLSSYAKKNPKLKLHFSVNSELVSRALEHLRCFHQI